MKSINQTRRRRGTTLIEVVMATMVVGVILVSAMNVVGASLRTRRATADLNTGARLAEQLLAECISMPYLDPESPGSSNGPESGEGGGNRKEFDDVDDYHNFSESQIRDKDDKKIDGFSGWTRSVTVQWANQLNGTPWLLWDTGLKRIVVTATAPDGTQTMRYALRNKDGSLQQAPSEDTTVVTMIAGELEVGGATSHAATSTLNHAADPNAP